MKALAASGRSFTRAIGLVAALAFGPAPASASPASPEALGRAEAAFRQANGAYERNDYSKAAELYRQAVDQGVADARLYYNYANALFRLDKLGPAILYYEKAHKLAPDDEDVAYNLRFANAQTVDKNPAPEPNLVTKVLWGLHSAFSIDAGLWTALGLFAGLCLLASAAVFAGTALRTVLFSAMGLVGLALFGLAPSLAYKIRQQETLEYGIVLKPALEMYSGPGENFQLLTKVHEGTKFVIVETRGGWASVKLLNGKGGYVRLADLGKV